MKKLLISTVALLLITAAVSCDKVETAYPKTASAGLDWSLYPDGDSVHYHQNHWPAFAANTNMLRNAIIEDFTGHWCSNCPQTGDAVHAKAESDPTRIFATAIHSGPAGLDVLQEIHLPDYPDIFYNDQGLEIGKALGSIPGSAFMGNPRIAINRVQQNGQVTCTAGSLNTLSSSILASTLKINLQAASNYFASTRGLFLHVEVDKLDQTLTNELGLVVYVVEDSMVAAQKMADQLPDFNYVHRDIMRGCIDGKALGRTLSAADLINGKYYVNYSYHLPDEFNVANMHLLIYVYDKTTYEIYQVIKHHL